jgi:poly(3-hydroxybutyrate) depolymerase
VTGTSAGGMMVNYLLCQSELFQNTATAVVDMLGGVGESFLGSCSPKRSLPHLILHGMTDPIITYDRDNVVDGSNFISTREWF